MMKKKIDRIEALHTNLGPRKETSAGSNVSANNTCTANTSQKEESRNKDESGKEEQQSLFTERYFTPNSNFMKYITDHKHK
jgi:hypothetical protein